MTTTDSEATFLKTDLMRLTNDELVRYGVKQPSATLLENELIHRVESYINMYGDYLDAKARKRD